ncbi:hypothetical protein [Erythrobacter crassostreae]|uniref:Uncharacterized protein n=1 Tax=Erythrobacter crassostreae TaxID=2828328 RepID=A0A9X1F499_9SPHN|nr:hypothetical protein [Erythrobacter crassostrea]MBV7259977.1 hypothetical protein [Erythrobacter crassostrea]
MSTPPLPEWCEAAPEAAFSAPSECTVRANAFERRIRFRNVTEYVAGGFVALACGAAAVAAFWKGEPLIGISMALVVAGSLFVMWSLHKRGSNLTRRPEDPCITHLRRQYQRQYDALRAVPKWYLGPFIPGMLMFYAVTTVEVAESNGWAEALSGIVGPASATIAIFGGVALANWWAARSLKAKISSLDALA